MNTESGRLGSSRRSTWACAAIAASLMLTGCTNLYVVSNNVNCKATRAGTQDDQTGTEVAGDATGGTLTRAEELARAFQSDIDCTGTSSAAAPIVEE